MIKLLLFQFIFLVSWVVLSRFIAGVTDFEVSSRKPVCSLVFPRAKATLELGFPAGLLIRNMLVWRRLLGVVFQYQKPRPYLSRIVFMSLRNDNMINIYYIKATKLYLELATHAVPTFSCLNFMLNLRQERKPSFHKLTDEKKNCYIGSRYPSFRELFWLVKSCFQYPAAETKQRRSLKFSQNRESLLDWLRSELFRSDIQSPRTIKNWVGRTWIAGGSEK